MIRLQTLAVAMGLVLTIDACAQNSANLRVKVLGPDGNAAAGVSVNIRQNGGSQNPSTDASGVATATVASGSAFLCVVSLTGVASVTFTQSIPSTDNGATADVSLGYWSSSLQQFRTFNGSPTNQGSFVTFNFAVYQARHRKQTLAGMQIALTSSNDASLNTTGTTDQNGLWTAPAVTIGDKVKVVVSDPNGAYQPYTTFLHPGQGADQRTVDVFLNK